MTSLITINLNIIHTKCEILLAGDEFPILIDIQYVDVRDQSLPDKDFYLNQKRPQTESPVCEVD